MSPRLFKLRYVDFSSSLYRMLDHSDADFTVIEEMGEVSDECARLIIRAVGRPVLTLTDAPLIPLGEMDEGDRAIVMRALEGLKEGEKLKIEPDLGR
ncbi:MAG: hypothetical protein GXO14_06210 [Thermococci archaeon]|nr:hypothetical protein [Thermococci archaeon]